MRMSSFHVQVGPNPLNSTLIRRRKFRHGQGRRPREDRGIDRLREELLAEPRGGRQGSFPRAFRGNKTLLIP